jgi:hypothetical protein
MIDDCGAVGGMRIGRGSRSTWRKPSPVSHCPPQIPHDLTWARNRAAELGSRRLTAWTVARPQIFFKVNIFIWQRLWSSGQSFFITDPEVPGSIPSTTIFSWEVVGLKRGSLSLVSITEELLQWKSSCCGFRKSRLTAVGIVALTTRHPLSAKVSINVVDKRRVLGRYNMVAEWSHGV